MLIFSTCFSICPFLVLKQNYNSGLKIYSSLNLLICFNFTASFLDLRVIALFCIFKNYYCLQMVEHTFGEMLDSVIVLLVLLTFP